MIIVLMGVTASGKTTVGRLLAQQLGWKFFEGDDFHSPASIEKMRQGVPLNDADREPWLKALRDTIRSRVVQGKHAVVACSALKRSYRRMLQVDRDVVFVYLKTDIDLIRRRTQHRTGHFMNPGLVKSQFEALEEPKTGIMINANLNPAKIVRLIRGHLSL
jgi:gluconokinase